MLILTVCLGYWLSRQYYCRLKLIKSFFLIDFFFKKILLWSPVTFIDLSSSSGISLLIYCSYYSETLKCWLCHYFLFDLRMISILLFALCWKFSINVVSVICCLWFSSSILQWSEKFDPRQKPTVFNHSKLF